MTEKEKYVVNEFFNFDYSEIGEYIDEYHTPRPLRNDELVDILNTQLQMIETYDKELMACYDTLITIIELCEAIVGDDSEGIALKEEMDNKNVAFLKECFKTIKNRDLRKMNSLIMEIKEYMKQKGGKEND